LDEHRRKALLYWILTLACIAAWTIRTPPGWDLAIYQKAIHSFELGHDPYQDEVAATGEYARNMGAEYGGGVSLYYVYSPVTLHIGAWARRLPMARLFYWLFYAAALITIVRVASLAITRADSRYIALLPPASLLFPGLLNSGTLLSGNVAIILYGLVFAAAALGWRRNRWLPFYAAVLICSLFKMPMLTLLAIPVFSARRQWIPAVGTAAVALAVFGAQSMAFPTLFRHQIQAVDHLFSFNRDVGCSPAGLFAGFLFDHHLPYFPLAPLAFLAYAVPVLILLYRFSQRFLAGELPFSEWMPILLVGTALLNPRLLEYDVLPITIPLGLIALRFAQRSTLARRLALPLCAVWIVANAVLSKLPIFLHTLLWKRAESLLLCVIFIAGALLLRRRATPQDELVEVSPINA